MHGMRDAENNGIDITGLRENWGRDNRIEKPYWDTLKLEVYFIF